MSTAMSLPPLGDLFAGDEEARNAYVRILPLEDQHGLLIRILGQLIIQAPSLEGRTYVTKCINGCATDQEIVELGKLYLNQFAKYFEEPGASSTPPHLSPDDIGRDLPDAAPMNCLEAKKQALMRDNYRCMLSGTLDYTAVEALPWLEEEVISKKLKTTNTRCCYILPEQEGDDGEEHGGILDILAFAHLFGGIPEHRLTKSRMYDLHNILTLEVGVHPSFKDFSIWLEPTGKAENQYTITRGEPYYGRDLPDLITFSEVSPDLSLPDPQYLAFHAACARVIQLSGAVDFILHILHEARRAEVLAEDGFSGGLLN